MKSVKINTLKPNPKNPRLIKNEKYKLLLHSVKVSPAFMLMNPIKVDLDNMILCGNMRYKACMELQKEVVPVEVFTKKHAEINNKARREEGIKEATYEEQCLEYIIKDNVSFGEHDWDVLANDWDSVQLEEWGLEVPNITETEKLSKIEFEDVYFKPKEKPYIELIDCVNIEKFNRKIEVIKGSKLNDKQKNVLTWFAYRFIKIDFENVANYYFFNAEENEKEIIEQLRLVLCDSGIKGFISDDLLKVHELIEDWKDD